MSIKIFFCYAHEDEALLLQLKVHLKVLERQGLVEMWYDRNISAGAEWQHEISQQLHQAQIILLLISPYFINSDYCYGTELTQALERHKRKEARVIPVILRPVVAWQKIVGHLQALPTDAIPVTDPRWRNRAHAFYNVTEGLHTVINDLIVHHTSSLPVSPLKQQLSPLSPAFADQQPEEPSQPALTEVLPSSLSVHSPGRTPAEQAYMEVCPYRELEAFREEDARFFFGRERFVSELLKRMRQAVRFLAVLGPSGSGKSSVVHAGLLPHLRRWDAVNKEYWGIISVQPADDPFQALNNRGFHCTSQDLVIGGHTWFQDHPHQKQLLLIFDQFEQFFILCPAEKQQMFLLQLIALLNAPLPITIIVILRNDFYNQLARSSVLIERLEKLGLLNIPPHLQDAELMAMIRLPAEAVGLRFEDGLVESIVNDALQESDGRKQERAVRSTILPLLEFALKRLWEQQTAGMLTHQAYSNIGGITGSLPLWADMALRRLPSSEQQRLARRIFSSLVHINNDDLKLPSIRRRRTLATLCIHEQEAEQIRQVVMHLTDAHLLITTRDQHQQEVVEIIHDALLREWAELKQWLQEDQDFLLWHQELERRSQAWLESATEPSERDIYKLIGGSDLTKASFWLGERPADLRQEEQAFIQASHIRQQQLQEQEQRLKQLSEDRQRNQRRSLILALTVLGVTAIGGSASLAWSLIRRYTRLYTYHGHRGPVWAVRWSSQAQIIASGSADGTIHIWEANPALRRLYLYTGHQTGSTVTSLSWSSDGYRVASGGEDKTVQVWSSDGHEKKTNFIYREHHSSVQCVAWSPDNRYIASGAGKGDLSVRVWEAMQQSRTLLTYTSHSEPINAVAWSPDSTYIASGSGDKTVHVWKALTGERLLNYTGHSSHILAVAWSPDGNWIASAGWDRQVHVWSATTGKIFTIYKGHTDLIADLAWSPDSTLIASASADKTVQVWNINTLHLICHYNEHTDKVNTVAWSPHDNYIASGSSDQTVHIWQLK